jgi:hypothetical protein
MLRRLFFVLALLVLPANAFAGTCTSLPGALPPMVLQNTPNIWDVTGGCATATSDDYVIGAGSYFTYAAPQSGTTIKMKSLTHTDQTSKVTFTPGSYLELSDDAPNSFALFAAPTDIQGAVAWRGRVTNVDYAAFSTGILLDVEPPPDASVVGQMLWVLSDETTGLTGTVQGPVQIGEGAANPEQYRSSFAKWRAYYVRSLSANTLVLSYDQLSETVPNGGYGITYPGAGAEPYLGSRTPAGGVTLTNPGIWTAGLHGLKSYIDILEATENLSDVTGDFAGRAYVRWIEGACAGLTSKIIMFYNDIVAGTDRIYVAGDPAQAGCSGTANDDFILIDGLRVGDPVMIVNPATIDGGADATAGSGGSVIFDFAGGPMNVSNARFIRLAAMDPTDLGAISYPAMGNVFNCAVCLLNDSAGLTNYASTSTFDWVEVGWGNLAASGLEGSHLFATMCAPPETEPNPIPGGAMWDVSGLKMSHLYVHDGIHAGVSNLAIRGITNAGCRNPQFERVRIERTPGSAYTQDAGDWSTGVGVRSYLYHFVGGDMLPGTPRTTGCTLHYNWGIENGGKPYVDVSTGSVVSDMFCGAAGAHQIWGGSYGTKYSNVVVGGNTGTSPEVLISSADNRTTAQYDASRNEIVDSVLFLLGSAAGITKVQGASMSHGVVTTTDETGGLRFGVQHTLDGVFATDVYHNIQLTNNLEWPSTYTVEDTAFIRRWGGGDANNTALLLNGTVTGLTEMTFRNTYNAYRGLSGNGILAYNAGALGTSVPIFNVIDSTFVNNPAGNNPYVGFTDQTSTDSGARVTGTCVTTTGLNNNQEDDATGFGANWTVASGSKHVMLGGIDYTESANLRAYIKQPGATGCEAAKPRHMGPRTMSESFALLGDIAILQWENFSSHNLPKGKGVRTGDDL